MDQVKIGEIGSDWVDEDWQWIGAGWADLSSIGIGVGIGIGIGLVNC